MLLGVVLLLPPIATVAVLAALVVMGAWEWSAFLRTSNVAVRAAYVALIAVLLYTAWHYTGSLERLRAALTVTRRVVDPGALSGWCSRRAASRRGPPRSPEFLRWCPRGSRWRTCASTASRGAEWLLFVFLLVWTADIGGYVFGRRYGRLRLAPQRIAGQDLGGCRRRDCR